MSGEDVDFNEFNTHIRDNLNETAPGIASTAGRLIVTDGANSIVERIPTTDEVLTNETTASTTFADLATSGPAVIVTSDTLVMVILQCQMSNNSAGTAAIVSFAISGATTQSASDNNSLVVTAGAADKAFANAAVFFETVTAGSNTFTMKYRVAAGTGSFRRRSIHVLPF